jgi:hypothetical protein
MGFGEVKFIIQPPASDEASTLFNRLAGKRLALVDDMPGLTRDRREAEATVGERLVRLVDTAGLEEAIEGSIAARMSDQSSPRPPASGANARATRADFASSGPGIRWRSGLPDDGRRALVGGRHPYRLAAISWRQKRSAGITADLPVREKAILALAGLRRGLARFASIDCAERPADRAST